MANDTSEHFTLPEWLKMAMQVEDVKAGYVIDCLGLADAGIEAKEILFRTVAAFQPKR